MQPETESDIDIDNIQSIVDEIHDDIKKKEHFSHDSSISKDFILFLKNNYKDALIILGCYIFLSLPSVRLFISKYMTLIDTDNDGNVQFSGIVAYGVVLCTLYLAIKKVISCIL